MKTLYLARHCEAFGQEADSPLTIKGMEQAATLCAFFKNKKVDLVVSSPFLRAVQTALPICNSKKLPLKTDSRLEERVLTTENDPNWYEKLRTTFDDLDVKFHGGESSREAMERAAALLDEVLAGDFRHVLLVTHGNLLALLLKSFNDHFNFNSWKNLSNPDVYQICLSRDEVKINRIWEK